ncbi:MAG: 3'-5' exonuclease [Candidatus Krumholzibacteriia bacterium]
MPALHRLHNLRSTAHATLLEADWPLTPQELAGRLFGAHRHEDPLAAVIVRHLLQGDPRFVRTHAGRWSAAQAPHLRRTLADTVFTVVDLETTGSVLGVDEIVEIGALTVRGGHVVDRLSTLVRSRRPLPPWVRRLTGIRSADLRDAPTFPEVAPGLRDMLAGAVFVAHDVRFDLPFLRWEFSRHGLELPEMLGVCTLQLSRLLWPDLPSHRLGDLARDLDVPHGQPHRAGADAEATAGVLKQALDGAGLHGLHELGDLFAATLVVGEEAAPEAAIAAEAAG